VTLLGTWTQPASESLSEVRLAIVGSVKFVNPDAYSLALIELDMASAALDPALIISGEAQGLDQFAKAYAVHIRIPYRGYPPEQQRWEPAGYKARNLLVANACTHLLAIRCQASRTYGSGFTADAAEQAGKLVRRVTIPVGGTFISEVGSWVEAKR
jgi:hypothetical protein